MDLLPEIQEHLLPLLLLILPGFISIRVFELMIPRGNSAGREVLEALSYGAVNFAIWSVPLVHWSGWLKDRPITLTLVVIGVLVVSPALLAVGARIVLALPLFRKHLVQPMPTAWDFFFRSGRPAWMRIRLKEGRFVGGFYGADSFAGSYPHEQDVYLQEAWELDEDGRFVRPIANSMGLLLAMEDCEVIELFNPEEISDEQESKRDSRTAVTRRLSTVSRARKKGVLSKLRPSRHAAKGTIGNRDAGGQTREHPKRPEIEQDINRF